MFIDAKVDYKNKKLILIHDDGSVEEKDLIPPYFYAIISKGKEKILKTLLQGQDTWIEKDDRVPIIFKGNRYEPDSNYIVYRVYTTSPNLVPQISETLKDMKVRVSACNLRYIIRNTFDLDIHFFNSIPLYFGFDERLMKRIKNVKGLVLDVEAVNGKPKLISLYWWRPFEEVRRDDVISLWYPEDQDELQKLLNKASLIIGHNILGFDLPVLERSGIVINRLVKSIFDTSVLLSIYGSSLKVGSSRSLLDVSIILKDDAGIRDEEIEIKRKVHGRIEGLSKEELIRYNVNDVVLTAKLLNVFYPFVAVISALTQIPVSEVAQLPSGMVAEYFLLHYCELLGFVPEYRPTLAKLEGERVWLRGEGREFVGVLQTDIKMMYPSWVLSHSIDPTLHLGQEKFNRKSGLGVLFSAVERLRIVRKLTKKLKKEDPLFEPVDAGVKSILNALAYGVQGKKSGLSIMGNPWCPSKIFYGTREAQFSTINYLRQNGYKVIYSDTDSFFIQIEKSRVEEVVNLINNYLKKWGLEVDIEDYWDKMYIYSKKNYILRKGDVVIIKGSALLNLNRIYTPECVSLQELLRTEDKQERLKILKEMIYSSSIEDLFIRSHQQIWRLIGKDLQSWKRLGERKSRYIRVLTTWSEKPTLVLKKGHIGHLLMPHSNPLFKLFIEKGNEIMIEDLDPFNIIELKSWRVDGYISRLKGRYELGDLLIYEDGFYTLWVSGFWYGIRIRSQTKWFPSRYDGNYPDRPIGILERIKSEIKVKKVEIDEEIFRRLVFEETKKTLKQYVFL